MTIDISEQNLDMVLSDLEDIASSVGSIMDKLDPMREFRGSLKGMDDVMQELSGMEFEEAINAFVRPLIAKAKEHRCESLVASLLLQAVGLAATEKVLTIEAYFYPKDDNGNYDWDAEDNSLPLEVEDLCGDSTLMTVKFDRSKMNSDEVLVRLAPYYGIKLPTTTIKGFSDDR